MDHNCGNQFEQLKYPYLFFVDIAAVTIPVVLLFSVSYLYDLCFIFSDIYKFSSLFVWL